MGSLLPHAVLAAAVVGSLIASCGGKTATVEPGSSGGSATGSSGSGSPSSSGTASGTGSGSGSSTGTCVDVILSTFDQACDQSSDCVAITSGTVCTGACLCGGNAAINVSDQGLYLSEVKAVGLGACGCPLGPSPACINHRCVPCTGGPSDPQECGPVVIGDDASVGPVCKQTMGGGSSGGLDGGQPCTVEASESCSDGTTYSATCSCPEATCYCTQSGTSGGSSGGPYPFSGCANGCASKADLQLIYEACGFPSPP